MTSVKLDNLTCKFGDQIAVDRLNFNINSGEIIALLGPSGCGKTTTLKMIAGLIEQTSGHITFDDQIVDHIAAENREAVLVFQKHLLFPHMNVAQNVGFALKMRGLPQAKINAQVSDMLELVELEGYENRFAHELSGGQQQRVALARGLIAQPKLLLLDEPLANLDANLRTSMRQLIKSLQQKFQITTIFVTHDQEEAVMLADRIILMNAGKIEQDGTPEDFFERPQNQWVAGFFQNTNFAKAKISGNKLSTPHGDLALENKPTSVTDGNVTFTVRPELIEIADVDNTENLMPAKVLSNIYLGTHTELTFRLDQAKWTMRTHKRLKLAEGDPIRIKLPKEHIWIFQN